MSTADSCLIASSGNFMNDIIEKYLLHGKPDQYIIRVSQIITLIIGALTLIVASSFNTVLEIILHAYSFMVAGLFIPTLGAYFWKKSNPTAALVAMIIGGGSTLILIFLKIKIIWDLEASIVGILFSTVTFISISLFKNRGLSDV
jgi:SSS family solute:Na+ symporter